MAFNAREQLANIAVVGQETARLLRTWRHWPSEYWSRPAYCPGWTAADAIAHLTTGGDFYAQVIGLGCQGNPGLPWGLHSPAEFRAARQAATQTLLAGGPSALLEGFAQATAQLQTVLESLHEADLAKMAWHPRGLVPIGSWIGMRLIELGIHDWDMRQPHDTPAPLAPTMVPALLCVIPEIQWQFLQQRYTEGLDGVYGLRAGDTSWGFTVQGPTVTYQATAPAACDATVTTDAESLILLTVGRADSQEKLRSAALTMSGNADKSQQLCATLFRSF